MKFSLVITFFLLLSFPLFGQNISTGYFDESKNEIDQNYQKEISKGFSNTLEWGQVVLKYRQIWEKQVNLEYERVVNSLEKTKKQKFQEIHKNWLQDLNQFIDFIDTNVNLRIIGSKPHTEFSISIMKKYRERALEYLELYYAMQLKIGTELDNIKLEFAE